MPKFRIAQSLNETENRIIVKIAHSKDGKFLGIRTQNNIIFFGTYETGKILLVPEHNVTDIPKDLLENLDLEYGVVSKTPDIATRK